MENRIVKILAIDDNSDNLTILKALIMESFSKAIVLSAFSGQKGLEIAKKEEPDVILLDIIMPGMDGYETCRKLKADKLLCDIPVVFVTAIKSDKTNRIKALEAGADAFLTKPIDVSELTAQIRAMLKIRKASIEKRDEKQMLAALVEEKTRELRDSNAELIQLVEAIKRDQALIQSIFDSIPGYLYVYDESRRLIKWNKKHETMTGYTEAELPHMTLDKWFDQEDLVKVNAAVYDVFEKGYGEVEAQLILKNGEKMMTRSSGAPLIMNGHKYFAGIGVDITERKQIEEALHKSEERFRVVQEISPDGFTILRPVRDETGEIIDFTFVYENQAIARLNQTDPEKVVGKRLLTLFPAHSGTSVFETYIHVANTGETKILEEINIGEVISKPKWLRIVVILMDEEIAILAQDITERKQSEYELQRVAEELKQQQKDLEKRLLQSVNAISKIGALRDVYTAGHQRGVEALSCAIAREMGLEDEQIHNLSFGALIHDIGKIFIPSEILNKPSKISALEYQILQSHVEESYNVVKEIDFPKEVHTMIHQHHERLDGSGYPQGLSGDEIILESRILAVADVVEAMTSHRPYRPALGIDTALEEILLHRGTKYDANVVDICVKLFKEDGYAF